MSKPLCRFRAGSQLRRQGPLSCDVTLLLETPPPVTALWFRAVQPGLCTSPRKACGLDKPGGSLALSLCQGKRFHHFNRAIMSQRFQSLSAGSSQSCNYPLAIEPSLVFFLKIFLRHSCPSHCVKGLEGVPVVKEKKRIQIRVYPTEMMPPPPWHHSNCTLPGRRASEVGRRAE